MVLFPRRRATCLRGGLADARRTRPGVTHHTARSPLRRAAATAPILHPMAQDPSQIVIFVFFAACPGAPSRPVETASDHSRGVNMLTTQIASCHNGTARRKLFITSN